MRAPCRCDCAPARAPVALTGLWRLALCALAGTPGTGLGQWPELAALGKGKVCCKDSHECCSTPFYYHSFGCPLQSSSEAHSINPTLWSNSLCHFSSTHSSLLQQNLLETSEPPSESDLRTERQACTRLFAFASRAITPNGTYSKPNQHHVPLADTLAQPTTPQEETSGVEPPVAQGKRPIGFDHSQHELPTHFLATGHQ
eukprot:scaffold15689_cov135-Isochrysis_galbana.AAC.9